VIGINTAIFSPNGANAGIAFAIPASVAKDVVAKLMKGGDIRRGWLGVKIEPVTPDVADSLGLPQATGALVNEPQAGSPGEKAGIKVGDVITAVDGEAVKGPKELARMIGSMDPGKTVDVTIWRGGKSMSLKLTLGTLPDENRMADAQSGQNAPDDQQQSQQQQDDSQVAKTLDQLGIEVQPSDDGHGVQVTSVDPNSDAADKGVKPGQKITSVNNQDVNSGRDIQRVVQAAKKDGRKKALFQLEDQTGNRFVALPIG
jgi:serine protease Do